MKPLQFKIWPPPFWTIQLAPRLIFQGDSKSVLRIVWLCLQHLLYLKWWLGTRRGLGDPVWIGSFNWCLGSFLWRFLIWTGKCDIIIVALGMAKLRWDIGKGLGDPLWMTWSMYYCLCQLVGRFKIWSGHIHYLVRYSHFDVLTLKMGWLKLHLNRWFYISNFEISNLHMESWYPHCGLVYCLMDMGYWGEGQMSLSKWHDLDII